MGKEIFAYLGILGQQEADGIEMIQARKKIAASFMIIAPFLFMVGVVFCAEAKKDANEEVAQDNTQGYVGEFLDTKVPEQNYHFIKNALIVFGNRGGPLPKTDKEKEEYIWDQMLLSYESFRRNIAVPQEEVDREVTNMLSEYKVDFDWKTNKDAFNKWVQEKAGESVELFENQIRYFLQLEKLRQQILDSIQPKVSEEEAHQAFLDEHNSLNLELIQFDAQKDAEDFYQKVKRGMKLWEKEKKEKPDAFKCPGFVTLIFLADIWRIPKDTLYEMMAMKRMSIHPPAAIYKGYGVLMLLDKSPADESKYAKLKEGYYEKIRLKKKYEGYNEWFKNLKEQAKIKIYEKEEKGKEEK